MESLKGSMSELMTQFQDRMSKFEAELQKAPVASTTVADLAADFTCYKNFVLDALHCLQTQMEALGRDLDTLEMRGRRKMLLLHGVTEEQSKEDTAQVVAKVVQGRLKVEGFTVSNIRRCHRMGRQTDASKPRPILVKFQEVDLRDKIWFAKTKLKGTGITLSEFLTRSRHQVFMAARDKFGVTNCWTKQGFIHVLGSDGTRHRISTHSELNKITEPEPDIEKQVTDRQTPSPAAPRKKRACANKK